MYCKNCGKHLEEGTRFCDRCGQSVRKSGNSEQAERRRSIEELKEERLNRQKRLAQIEAREEFKKNRKKKRRKKTGGIIAFFMFAVILAIVTVVITYKLASTDSENNGNNSAAATPMPTASNVVVTQTSSAPVVDTDPSGYRIFEINNVGCPYPSSFSKKAVSGNEKLSLVDSIGGATMSISQEQGVSDTPAELMKEFAGAIGVNPDYSLAGKDNYTVTSRKGNMVYHRKCIISGTTAIYYDFQYSDMSSSRAQYEQYIQYIDNNMIAK